MAVRTTVDIPEPLHSRLLRRAEQSDASIRSLHIHAIEEVYREYRKGTLVTGPLITGRGRLGPKFRKTTTLMISFFLGLTVWLALSVEGHSHNPAAWIWIARMTGEVRR